MPQALQVGYHWLGGLLSTALGLKSNILIFSSSNTRTRLESILVMVNFWKEQIRLFWKFHWYRLQSCARISIQMYKIARFQSQFPSRSSPSGLLGDSPLCDFWVFFMLRHFPFIKTFVFFLILTARQRSPQSLPSLTVFSFILPVIKYIYIYLSLKIK